MVEPKANHASVKTNLHNRWVKAADNAAVDRVCSSFRGYHEIISVQARNKLSQSLFPVLGAVTGRRIEVIDFASARRSEYSPPVRKTGRGPDTCAAKSESRYRLAIGKGAPPLRQFRLVDYHVTWYSRARQYMLGRVYI